MGRDYRKIKAWKLADELVVSIYEETADFPKSELYGLISPQDSSKWLNKIRRKGSLRSLMS